MQNYQMHWCWLICVHCLLLLKFQAENNYLIFSTLINTVLLKFLALNLIFTTLFNMKIRSKLYMIIGHYHLMPWTNSVAQGWCMLKHMPSSDISCNSLSWSRSPSLLVSVSFFWGRFPNSVLGATNYKSTKIVLENVNCFFILFKFYR